MLLQSIIDCSAIVEPLWISVKARLICRKCERAENRDGHQYAGDRTPVSRGQPGSRPRKIPFDGIFWSRKSLHHATIRKGMLEKLTPAPEHWP
jgi:hypothetical protein